MPVLAAGMLAGSAAATPGDNTKRCLDGSIVANGAYEPCPEQQLEFTPLNDAWIRANCTEGPWLIPKMKDTNCGNLYVRQGHSPLGRMQKINVITDVIATCLRTTVTPICNNERIISPEKLIVTTRI